MSSDMLVFKNDQFNLLHSLNRVQLPHFNRNALIMAVSTTECPDGYEGLMRIPGSTDILMWLLDILHSLV